jgi:hypothetical protein
MFFLIRCAFWLTIVFSTIFSPDHGSVAPQRAVAPAQQTQAAQQAPRALSADVMSRFARAWMSATLQKVWVRATGGCAVTAPNCAALAGRLEAFARKHPYEQLAKLERKKLPDDGLSAVPADVPLPPPRPQHFHSQERLSQAGLSDGIDAVSRARLAFLARGARS